MSKPPERYGGTRIAAAGTHAAIASMAPRPAQARPRVPVAGGRELNRVHPRRGRGRVAAGSVGSATRTRVRSRRLRTRSDVMPNQPRKDNPSRAIRVEDELWHDALDAAAENDDTVSQVVRRALRDYVKRT